MTAEINLNKIRSLKSLAAIRKPLAEFVAFDATVMRDVYREDYGWGSEDYDADMEQVIDLLNKVDRRTKSLGHHLAKAKTI